MGAIAVESLMRARRVVVGEVPAQQASEMPFVEDDDVIEAFPSNRPDDALGEGILPGRSWGDEDLVDPHALHPPRERVAVDGASVDTSNPAKRGRRKAGHRGGRSNERGLVRLLPRKQMALSGDDTITV